VDDDVFEDGKDELEPLDEEQLEQLAYRLTQLFAALGKKLVLEDG